MGDFGQSLMLAGQMILSWDPVLLEIVVLSVGVSLTAVVVAFIAAAPLGALLAVTRFPGKLGVTVALNALLGLPPVVIGLVVYLLLSRSGPLGDLGLLFTPTAMVIAQALLALPLIAALTHRQAETHWAEFGDALRVDGASAILSARQMLAMGRAGLITVFLAAFGRLIAEVGAIIIVGGNIAGHTRTMTTAIALETARGDLPRALALGIVLIGVSVAVSTLVFFLGRRRL